MLEFCEDKPISTTNKSNRLSLLDQHNLRKVLKRVPRTFEICTNNGSCYFNTYIIQDISTEISEFLKVTPDANRYDISVDNNIILKKIEEVCQGKDIKIYKEEISDYNNIVDTLQLISFPTFLSYSREELYHVRLNLDCYDFLQNIPIKFIISTNKDQYCCNIFGICSSKVILKFVTDNPDVNQYIYDYDDEFHEFQKICDFFNFENFSITPSDFDLFKKIAEDLQIDVILYEINTLIQFQEKMNQKIEKNQKIIDNITEIFEWLYKINELSVPVVRNSIINSVWSRNKENIQELTMFILQVIKTDLSLHQSLLELLIQLDSENFEFKIMMPLIKDELMNLYGRNPNICAFIYRLYQKGIFTNEELFPNFEYILNKQMHLHSFDPFFLWFLPEIIELDKNIHYESFITNTYLPDNLDLYKKMRDSFEPNDEITRSLRKDDIDTFLSILSKNQIINLSNCFVPNNIFDTEIMNNNMNYINYAAAFGSIKCFKYLMLNHVEIDSSTFYYSIYGGNSEIIKIIDDKLHCVFDNEEAPKFLFTLIEKHRNDLFDWVLEQKITKNDQNSECLKDIIEHTILNGNIHALVTLIDKSINMTSVLDSNGYLFKGFAARQGFYHLLKFLDNISVINNSQLYRIGIDDYITYDNIKIFKILTKTINNEFILIHSLETAIKKDKIKIISYFFDEQIDKITNDLITRTLHEALKKKSDELFYLLFDKLKKNCTLTLKNYKWDISLLEAACAYAQIKPFYTIINLIPKDKDFTQSLMNAIMSNSIELYKYLIDHKYEINYINLFNDIAYNTNINYDIILWLFKSSGLKIDKFNFLPILQKAIEKQNKNLVLFLLQQNLFYDDILVHSIQSNNLDIVDIVLKYKSTPDFINKGNALSIAVMKNNLEIVKRLLSLPSINPYLYSDYIYTYCTPLMIAASNLSFPIINELLPLYSKDIILHRESIEYLLNELLSTRRCEEKEKNHENILKTFKKILDIENIQMIFNKKNQQIFFKIFSNPLIDIRLVQLCLNINFCDVNYCSNNTNETLLIAAINTRRIDIIKLLINSPNLEINMQNCQNETALHHAVLNDNIEIVSLLLSVPSLDPFIYDEKNRTPLMIAESKYDIPIINEIISFCIKNNRIHKDSFLDLLQKLTKRFLKNIPNYNNHHNNYNAIEEYDQPKENINIVNTIEMILSIKDIQKIFDNNNRKILIDICVFYNFDIVFLHKCLKVDAIDPNCSSSIMPDTLLIAAIKAKRIDIIKLLISYPKTNVNILNFYNEDALSIAIDLQEDNIEIIKLLLSVPSINIDKSTYNYYKQSPLEKAISEMNFQVINEIITFYAKDIILHQSSITKMIQLLLDKLEKSCKFESTEDDQRDYQEKNENIMKAIEKILCIENIQKIFNDMKKQLFLEIITIPYIDIKFVQRILKFDVFNINIASSSDGNTPLILSLKSNRPDIAELLINDARTNINKINFNKESALMIATEMNIISIAKLLINDDRFDPEESLIENAFIQSRVEISRILIPTNLFNINCKIINDNKFGNRGDTALIYAAKNKDLMKLEDIINHPEFDKVESNLQRAVEILFGIDEKKVLCDFIRILKSNNLLDYCFQFIETFYSIVNGDNFDILKEIDNLVIPDQFIKKLFCYSMDKSNDPIQMMIFLIDYDKLHNNIMDIKNETFLTKIQRRKNICIVEEIVNLLIENDYDVNKPNKEGIYPLEHAINSEFVELASALLKTQKVNYKQIINYCDNQSLDQYESTGTYLHLAATCSTDILGMLLDLNIFDINARNSKNDTPLMLACKYYIDENIKLLFQNDKLDFRCKNDNNKDALQIVQGFYDEDNENLSKEQYLDELISIICDY